jgi:periplasmic divalent cation tolerance protein
MAMAVFVTIPKKNVKRLVGVILNARLAACVNVIKNVDSYFWWENKITNEKEALLMIKTKEVLYKRLKKLIKDNHPYSVPEIIGFKINKINKAYLNWLIKEARG